MGSPRHVVPLNIVTPLVTSTAKVSLNTEIHQSTCPALTDKTNNSVLDLGPLVSPNILADQPVSLVAVTGKTASKREKI